MIALAFPLFLLSGLVADAARTPSVPTRFQIWIDPALVGLFARPGDPGIAWATAHREVALAALRKGAAVAESTFPHDGATVVIRTDLRRGRVFAWSVPAGQPSGAVPPHLIEGGEIPLPA